MKKCPYCGAEIPAELSYCPSCGGPVGNVKETPPEVVAVQKSYNCNNTATQNSSNSKTVIVILAFVAVVSLVALFVALSNNSETAGSAQVSAEAPIAQDNQPQQTKNTEEAETANARPDNYYAPIESATAYSVHTNMGVRAINEGNLSLLNGIYANPVSYENQCKMVTRLYKKGIKEEFLTGWFEFVEFDDNDNVVANTYEKHRIIGSSGDVRYTDCFYRCTIAGKEPYCIMSFAKGENPFVIHQEGYIISDADLYVLPSTEESLAFERVKSGESVKVCEYPECPVGCEIYELSPKTTGPNERSATGMDVVLSDAKNGWIFIKHPKYGYGWIKSSVISY